MFKHILLSDESLKAFRVVVGGFFGPNMKGGM
jgi:hypothetical protein